MAHKLGLGVIGSSTLLQMHLFQKPFKRGNWVIFTDSKMELQSDVQLALQLHVLVGVLLVQNYLARRLVNMS